LSQAEFAPLAFLREKFGFVPSVLRAQTARPDVLEAQVFAIRCILVPEKGLSRRQTQRAVLACRPTLN
jgi:hypothetical protein